MTKKLLTSLMLILTFFSNTYACLNRETKILSDGTFLYKDQQGNVPYGHDFHKEGFKKGIIQLENLYKATKNIDYLSDKALLLILLKKYRQAIELYLAIEQLEPNRYSTASNLGTAYELTGNNWLALKWIKKAVRLNPQSHNNSEWIHVRILRAKIKGELFFTSKFLIKTDFGTENIPKTKLTKQELNSLHTALYYQLNERISFVKPKNKIAAQLLFDLGSIAFLLGKHEDAIADHKLAKEYGFENALTDKRIKESTQVINQKIASENTLKNQKPKLNFDFVLWSIYTSIALFIPIALYSRKRKVKIHNPFLRARAKKTKRIENKML